jgi:SSS family solute:Na+ symporter
MAWVFLLLLGMAFVPLYLLTGISTTPEFMGKRFGPKCYAFMSFYALLTTIVMWLGGTLFAGGALLAQLLNWDFMPSVWVLIALSTSFTVTGGLVAVAVTDSYQSILIIIGATALSIIVASQLESLDVLTTVQCGNTPQELTWKLIRPADSAEPWYAFVLGYPVLSIWFWCSDQTIVQRVLGARDLKQGQLGTLFAAYLKILTPFIFLMPGIFAAKLHPGIEDDKQVFLTLVNNYLPTGLVGLIVAVLVAAAISTLGSGLNSFSTIFTLDIYQRWMTPLRTQQATKRLGQAVTIASALISVAVAWLLSKSEGTNMFNLLQGIIAYMAPPISAVFILGTFWRRATAKAALVTLCVGAVVSISVGVCDLTNVLADESGIDVWPHFLFLSFLLFIGLIVLMLVVSLVTEHDEQEVSLPSLTEAYQRNSGVGLNGIIGWISLAITMVALYVFFQFIN